MSLSLLAASLFLHLLATVIWLGGLFLLTLLVWPETRRSLAGNPQRYRLLGRLRKRFQPLTWLSLAVLIVTGVFQMTADAHYEGMLQFGSPWSRAILLKPVALAGMVVCCSGAWRQRWSGWDGCWSASVAMQRNGRGCDARSCGSRGSASRSVCWY